MNQATQSCTSYFQRLFRKMYGTVLFVRIIPTVILSFSCVLLLFLALVFGLSLPLVLRYLLGACLVGMCSIASSYLLWEKIVEHPSQNLKKVFTYLLISECVLPCISVFLMALFLHWLFIFFALFPLAFGWAFLSGRFDRIMRLILIGIQFLLLVLAVVISFIFLYTEHGFGVIFGVFLCCGLYFIYNLRLIFLLCKEPPPYTNTCSPRPYRGEILSPEESEVCEPDDNDPEDDNSAWGFSVPPEVLLDDGEFLYEQGKDRDQLEEESIGNEALPLDEALTAAPLLENEPTSISAEQPDVPDVNMDIDSVPNEEIFSGEAVEPEENQEPLEENPLDDSTPES